MKHSGERPGIDGADVLAHGCFSAISDLSERDLRPGHAHDKRIEAGVFVRRFARHAPDARDTDNAGDPSRGN